MFVDGKGYVANVGDSRAVLSRNQGAETVDLSEDHKPDIDSEKSRIEKYGEHIYQTQSAAKVPDGTGNLVDTTLTGPV